MSLFKPASKAQSYLRLAVFGPSGSGKTMSSLRLATGIGGSIAVIDTERGSASKYADRFKFDVAELADDKSIDAIIQTLKGARTAGYNVVIIDSLSHAWKELLEEVDKLAHAKYRGNTWSAWSEGTPKQNKLVDAILSYPGHVIATMRSKTEWVIEQGKNGKGSPVRVGMAPEQGKGIEYEFDLLLEMSVDNIGHITKDRTGKFHGQLIEKPGEEFGAELRDWLGQGDAMPPPPPMPDEDGISAGQVKALQTALGAAEFGTDQAGKAKGRQFIAFLVGIPRLDNVMTLTESEVDRVLKKLGTGTNGSFRVDKHKLETELNAWYEHLDLQRSVATLGERRPHMEEEDVDDAVTELLTGGDEPAEIPEFNPNEKPSKSRKSVKGMKPIEDGETADLREHVPVEEQQEAIL